LRAGAFYHHEENQAAGTGGAVVSTSANAQTSLNLTLGLKYSINKHFTAHVDYEFTNESGGGGASSGGTSSGATSGFSRNHYSAGLTYKY
jgi:opacity protein-like surface antigen